MITSRVQVLVVGGGVSGLSLAMALENAGIDYVLVEATSEVGGLCSSFQLPDNSWHDYGPHIFHASDGFDWFRDLVPDCIELPRKDVVGYREEDVDYPIQTSLEHLVVENPAIEVSNYGDYCRRYYGRELSTEFFFPYNELLYGTHITNISHKVATRVPTTGQRAGSYLYPRSGRFSSLPEAMAARIPSQRLRVSWGVDHIDPLNKIAFSGGDSLSYEVMVWCAPIDILLTLLGSPVPLVYSPILLVTRKQCPTGYLARYNSKGPEHRRSCEGVLKDSGSPYIQDEVGAKNRLKYDSRGSYAFIIPKAYACPTSAWYLAQTRVQDSMKSLDIRLHGRAGRGIHMNIWPIVIESRKLAKELM